MTPEQAIKRHILVTEKFRNFNEKKQIFIVIVLDIMNLNPLPHNKNFY